MFDKICYRCCIPIKSMKVKQLLKIPLLEGFMLTKNRTRNGFNSLNIKDSLKGILISAVDGNIKKISICPAKTLYGHNGKIIHTSLELNHVFDQLFPILGSLALHPSTDSYFPNANNSQTTYFTRVDLAWNYEISTSLLEKGLIAARNAKIHSDMHVYKTTQSMSFSGKHLRIIIYDKIKEMVNNFSKDGASEKNNDFQFDTVSRIEFQLKGKSYIKEHHAEPDLSLSDPNFIDHYWAIYSTLMGGFPLNRVTTAIRPNPRSDEAALANMAIDNNWPASILDQWKNYKGYTDGRTWNEKRKQFDDVMRQKIIHKNGIHHQLQTRTLHNIGFHFREQMILDLGKTNPGIQPTISPDLSQVMNIAHRHIKV